MIPKSAVLRIARPTDNLAAITKMYVQGLGFELIGSFENHQGFDGSIIGHPHHPYHLEFTHHCGTHVGRAPTQDNLLVFYFSDTDTWHGCCEDILSAGFIRVESYNSYWDVDGQCFEDIDGYRIVLQNRAWKA